MKIAIVGGGIGGLMTAFKAVCEGHDVTLFEKNHVGAGASGLALGVLVPVTGMNRPIDQLQRAGIAEWPALAAQLSAEVGIEIGDFWREWVLPGGLVAGQVRLPEIFWLLKRAIEARGGVVKEGESVASPALLRADFDVVVLAAGLGNAELCGAVLKVGAGLAGRFKRKGAPDVRAMSLTAGDNLFVCPTWDNTLIAGSVNWEMDAPGDGRVPDDKLHELVTRVERLVPGLELVEAWVGYRPMEIPRLPLVRDLGDGVLAVVGLGKIGIGVSPMIWPALKVLIQK